MVNYGFTKPKGDNILIVPLVALKKMLFMVKLPKVLK